jgi:hypothetical protein
VIDIDALRDSGGPSDGLGPQWVVVVVGGEGGLGAPTRIVRSGA